MHQAPGTSCGILHYPGLLSCPFYAIPIRILFLIYEIFHLFVSFHFLLLLAVTIIECNNNFLFFTSIIILNIILKMSLEAERSI